MADNEQRMDESKKAEKRQKLEEQAKAEKPEVDYTMLYDSDGYSDDEERQRDIKKYYAQYEASGGYEVEYFPKLTLMGLTVPVSDFPETDGLLEDLSILALQSYNEKHGTNYGLSKVVNGTARVAGGMYYKVTFCAKEPEDSDDQTFKAHVQEEFPTIIRSTLSCEITAGISSSKATT